MPVSEGTLPQPDVGVAVGRMARAVAHHLNGLLMVVEGNAAFLRSSVDDPRLAAEVQEIQNACGRTGRLSEQLLSVSGQRWAEPVIVDLKHAVTEMEPGRFVPDEVAFCTDFTARECQVWADPSHLREVVLALVLNARAAVSAGGTILLRIDLVRGTPVQGRSAQGWVELEVADNGVGMDPETVESAILPFFSTRERAQGRGLGLSVAHGLIRQAGGFLKISSGTASGTSVRFWLPAMNVAATR
jgi:signal transduction histidine kinase